MSSQSSLTWSLMNDPSEWHHMRERWHYFQGVRAWLFASAFVLLTIPLVLSRR